MTQLMSRLSYEGVPVWRHALILRWTTQIVSGVLVVFLVAWFFINIGTAIGERNIPYGYSFLDRAYQTPIGHHFIPYVSSDSFLYALGVAISNTVVVSIVGVIIATLLGIGIGVARLSGNWIVSKLALVYIEIFRNIPLLVQLFFWFYFMLALPQERDAFVVAERVFISNAGISIPWFSPPDLVMGLAWIALVALAAAAGAGVHWLLSRRETITGSPSYPLVSGIATAVVGIVGSWFLVTALAGNHPFVITVPEQQGTFGRAAGGYFTPASLIALLMGLIMYTAAFIAEIVRAGITSVGHGQKEAARALGLSAIGVLRHVTFPQALRVIIPPLISQFLNLTKNSSLAGAIGYSDLTSVAKTMTQTAPAVSIFVLIMLAYLAMSLSYSLIGNLYNRHIRFAGS